MKIRYSEIFWSFQGEGKHAGMPAVWLRFFGCNLNCSGFGQKCPTRPETYELPYKEFDETKVKTLNDLPVWSKGCDSSYSWAAKFKHLAKDGTVEEIVDKLEQTIAENTHGNVNGSFINPNSKQPILLCFTGGEPMLNQKAIVAIMRELEMRGNVPQIVVVETNGTRPITNEMREMVQEYTLGLCEWHWAVSPKLFNVSGELKAIKPDVIADYYGLPKLHLVADSRDIQFPQRFQTPTMILKFVCNGTEEAWKELDLAVDVIRHFVRTDIPVWVMPVGATEEDQRTPTVAMIALEAMRRGYNVATRNHVYVFGNSIGR